MEENKNIPKRRLDEEEDNGTDKQPRLSFFFDSSAIKKNPNREKILDEVDKVEQLITLNLQKINENLVSSNSIITGKLIPSLESFNRNSYGIYNNVSHIKEFFENAANVNILTKKDVNLHGDEGAQHNQTTFEGASSASSSFVQGGVCSDRDDNGTGANHSSNLSHDFNQVNERYRQTLADSSHRDNTTTALHLVDDSATASFLKELETNLRDESTGKVVTGPTLAPGKEAAQDAEPGEVTSTGHYVKEIMSGYESPPWEEPPVLQSSKFKASAKHRKGARGAAALAAGSNDDSDGESDGTDRDARSMAGPGLASDDEDVSIRFPSSPKYGGGGRLLRTDRGRQIALDFARSEMVKDHPILSLQDHSKDDDLRNRTSERMPPPDSSDPHSSSFEDAPELASEHIVPRNRD